MRKPIIIIITAVTAMAGGCLAPVAQADTAQPVHQQAAQAAHQAMLGDASIDGFKAWQSGPVAVSNQAASVPITYNKAWPKLVLAGIVGVKVYRDDTPKPGWATYGERTVYGTSGDETYTAGIGGSSPASHLKPNHTYHYYVYIEYGFETHNGPSGSFTTSK